MNSPAAAPDKDLSPSLDDLPSLPAANTRSLWMVILVQALNSFSDNLVKMLIIVFAKAVAGDEPLGARMSSYLGLTFMAPYIIFAPVAGWVSDRFSKQRVMLWMQALQVLIFIGFFFCIGLGQPKLSLQACLATFFLLAMQAAFFAPAKMGVLKELAGSRRLGLYSGLQQMTMFAAILLGMGIAGIWFAGQLKAGRTPWQAVMPPLYLVTGLAVLQTFAAALIKRTPDNVELPWRSDVWLEHVGNMRLLFSRRAIGLAAAGIAFFWFIANGVGTALVGVGNEFYAQAEEASTFNSKVSGVLGTGIMLGSLLVGFICRRRIELGVVPVAAFILMLGLLVGSQLSPASGSIFIAMLITGASAGMFMVPLYSFVQDRCEPTERARVLAGIGFVDSLAGSVANLFVLSLLAVHLPSRLQLAIMGCLTLLAVIAASRILLADLVRMLCTSLMRLIYSVRVANRAAMPREGGVLLLPNHMTYADALLLSLASDRPLRFVIWDEWYADKRIQWFLKLFNTVPISPKRAKEAVRTVAEALEAGGVICLFPEGQITRNGMVNEIRKGYELMARKANATVLTVYMDGLWGSIFSNSDGRFLGKWPKALRYPVAIHFGQPMTAKEATAERVQHSLLALSSEAFLARDCFTTPADPMPLANALRLAQSQLFPSGSHVISLAPESSPMGRTLASLKGIHLSYGLDETSPADALIVGSPAMLQAASQALHWSRAVRVALCWQSPDEPLITELAAKPVMPGWWEPSLNAILAQTVPTIEMASAEDDPQRGGAPNSLGRLLNGLSAENSPEGLLISGIIPRSRGKTALLPGWRLDAQGLVVLAQPTEKPSPSISSPS